MPHQFVGLVEPIVQHGLWELSTGAPITHVLREVAVTSALVGAGLTPSQARRVVEQREPALIGMHPGEAFEPYHPGYGHPAGAGGMPCGWGPQMPGVAAPWGPGGYMPTGMWLG